MGIRSTSYLYMAYELKQKWKEVRRKELDAKNKAKRVLAKFEVTNEVG